jgi:hypothetical protein
MKKTIAFSTVILALLMILVGCSQSYSDETIANESRNKIRIYTFSGENDSIAISNGIIHITGELEQFVGGELSFKREVPLKVKEWRSEFYFYLEGDKTIITSTNVISEGSEDGTTISPYMGSTVAETLFSFEAWDIVSDSLHFLLSGAFMDGESFEYTIALTVTEVSFELTDYRPMIFARGILYGETANVVGSLPDGAFMIGAVERMVAQYIPMAHENITSNAMPIGSEIYLEEDSNIIYVQLPNGQYSIYVEIE